MLDDGVGDDYSDGGVWYYLFMVVILVMLVVVEGVLVLLILLLLLLYIRGFDADDAKVSFILKLMIDMHVSR